MEKNITTETPRHREKRKRNAKCGLRNYLPISPSPHLPFFFALCLCVSVVNLSCGSKPTDLRTIIPADALVYLETHDLRKAVAAITENPSFQHLAKTQPDISALRGIKLVVAVTGFETKEQQVTEENSVLNFRPRFVAVAETNAWNYQALSFTENKLGEFINETYGGEVVLETTDRHDGKYFVWTGQDGRKAYALVSGSLIFFGNDESAIEKCLAVKRGEADSIAKNPKVTDGDRLAFGYIPPDGIAQIANIAGISLAKSSSEEGEVQSFIARVLPEILRNSINEITWTASNTGDGIEDKFLISTNPNVAQVFGETMTTAGTDDGDLGTFVPSDFVSATRYDLKDPQIAWRSILLTAQKQVDQLSGELIASFSGSLFESYGVEQPELFLSSIGSQIITVRFDSEGDEVAFIVPVKDDDKFWRSLHKDIRFQERHGAEFVSASIDKFTIVGRGDSVLKCWHARQNAENRTQHPLLKKFAESDAVAVTIANDAESARKIVEVLAVAKEKETNWTSSYLTETRFNQTGIERRTVSEFGLIGSIIEQLGKNN